MLFSPITIGGVTVPNRFVVPPMGNNFANTDGTLSETSAAYYEARAKGGFGLITIEATVVDPTAKGGPHKPCLFSDTTIESFRMVADRCHRAGAKVSVQLQHAGPEGNPALTGYPLQAASPVESSNGRAIPEEISKENIYSLVSLYGNAARRAQQAGIDMVEIHCAHGYLIHSFLSPRTNHRIDEFGGCLENRLRIVRLILEDIRKKTGPAFPVLCRINGCDDVPGGLTVQDSAVIAACLEDMGIDGLHVSRAVHLRDDKMWAPTVVHGGFNADIVTEIKRAVSIPVIAVGRFTDPSHGELLVRQGRTDLIAFGRQSIADPALPEKARAGKMEQAVPCVGCLQGCVPNMYQGKPITCMVNPVVGEEGQLQPAVVPKKVLVVGGGPAGMMAAITCAQRGHSVKLYEAADHLGGQMAIAAVPPGKGDITGMLSAYAAALGELAVEVNCGVTVTPEQVQEEQPDAVVIAAGAKEVVPPIKGMEQQSFVTASDVLQGKASCGSRVLILGGGFVGLETAAFLGERKHQVTVLERREKLGDDLNAEHWTVLQKMLEESNVQLLTGVMIEAIAKDGIVCSSEKLQFLPTVDYDTIVLSLGKTSRQKLYEFVKEIGMECYIIGDAAGPAKALQATREGYTVGKRI